MLVRGVHAIPVTADPLPFWNRTRSPVARGPRDRHLPELEGRGALRARRLRIGHLFLSTLVGHQLSRPARSKAERWSLLDETFLDPDCRSLRCLIRQPKNGLSREILEAAGLGLEPRLPDSESGVLPLDDPAKGFSKCSDGVRRDFRPRGGRPARGFSRPRCRYARRPRRTARGPTRAASPGAANRSGRCRSSCSS